MLRVSLSVLCVLAVAVALTGNASDRTGVRPDSPTWALPTVAPAPLPRRPLPFFYDLYTFRGDDARTAVVAAFAVPAGRLKREREDSEVRYRFDVTLVLADTARRSVSRTDDSVVVASPRSLAGDHLLHTHVEVQAPPSGSTVQRVIMTDASVPGIGQLYGAPFPIPDYSGSNLMLSDIALGRPDVGAGWTRGDVTLALLPTSQFPEGAFDVYYEVYNLPFGARYSTEIAIEPLDDGGEEDRVVRARFSGEADSDDGGSLYELRRLEATLEKGRYRMTVTVINEETGARAERTRVFQVRGWRKGATLIRALPRGVRASAVAAR